jgi:hypothetical protein
MTGPFFMAVITLHEGENLLWASSEDIELFKHFLKLFPGNE